MVISDSLLNRAQRAVAVGEKVYLTKAEADELGDLLTGMAYEVNDTKAGAQEARFNTLSPIQMPE